MTLRLTKEQAATRQTEAAIDAMHRGDFDIAITLAGAAEGMFDRTESHLFKFMRDHPKVVNVRQKDWIATINGARDWLKHNATKGPIELQIADAAIMITRAASKLETWTPKIEEFRSWMVANYDRILTP
jgi:hypothetical protein